MRNEITHSIEMDELMNAERAYELYWAQVLVDQRAFQCPEPACPAEFTCINMYRAENEQKQQPHFRTRLEHSADCEFFKEQVRQGQATASPGNETNFGSPTPDRFLLRRPANDLVKVERVQNANSGRRAGIRPDTESIHSARRRSTEFYSLGRIVSRWLQARRTGTTNNRTIQVATAAPTTYADFFISLYPRNRSISNQAKIYWGKAQIKRTKENDGYAIYFSTPLTYDHGDGRFTSIKPMLRISDQDLDTYALRHALKKIISRAIDSDDGQCTAFTYVMPRHTNGAFINMTPSNLDLIAIEPIALLGELHKNSGKRNQG